MYEPKSFPNLENLKSLTQPQIGLHLKLYGGYVRASNVIVDRLRAVGDTACDPAFSEIAELKRRQPFAYNGMVLHELYFEALGADEGSSEALDGLLASYGGKAKVVADLANVALCGSGWSLLLRDRALGALSVAFVAEHHVGLPVGHDVLLALDSWEHAYVTDYGADRAKYAGTVVNEINWRVVAKRAGS